MPGGGRQITHRPQFDHSGEVQQRVEPVGKRLLGEGPGEAVGGGEVAHQGLGAGQFPLELPGPARVAGEQQYVVAAFTQPAGRCRADARSGSGDQMCSHAVMVASPDTRP